MGCNEHPVRSSIVIAYILSAMLLIPALSLPCSAFGKEPFRTMVADVVKVSTGDTITVIDYLGNELTIRLYGIDAPEHEKIGRKSGRLKPGQAYGAEAWQILQGKVLHKKVVLDAMDLDRHDRLACVVWLGNRIINQEMIAEGYAWAYRSNLDAPYVEIFIPFEEQARSRRLGLWQQDNPEPPWEFRKRMRALRKAVPVASKGP
jgi:micrococcal nuclease